MESEVKIYERDTFRDPTLIVSVPGIGLCSKRSCVACYYEIRGKRAWRN